MKNYQAIIDSPIGKLGIRTASGKLIGIEFLKNNNKIKSAEDSYSQSIVKQLKHYFKQADVIFDVQLLQQGTVFQQKVWQAMRKIPAGKVLSYGDLAKQLKTSPRAIGNACRSNPTPLIVPCHRVVAKHHIGGFSGMVSGSRIRIKKTLLQHEGIEF